MLMKRWCLRAARRAASFIRFSRSAPVKPPVPLASSARDTSSPKMCIRDSGSPALQESLPEFQTCATAVLLAAWLAAGALSTRHFAGRLRRDAALLTAATGAIAARRLDVPLDGGARVRELGESLAAMEQLRQALARSLSEQWAMEQERTQALAALAHDLKTPLSIVSGSAELLEEDALSPAQRERVDAILRSAGRIRDYMEQLLSLIHI